MQPVPCAAAVVFDDRRRLLLIRRATDPGRGLWSLPGGRVEAGEDPSAAAIREVAEETGLQVRVTGVLGRVEVRAPGFCYDVLDVLAEPTGGRLRAGDDAADVAWFPVPALAGLAVTEGLLAALGGWGLLGGA